MKREVSGQWAVRPSAFLSVDGLIWRADFPPGVPGGRGGFIEVGEDGRCLSEHCEGQARARGKYLRRGVA